MSKRVWWRDPDRWVSADQQRDGWLGIMAMIVVVIVVTCVAVAVGVIING